jgi:hypothetical protein
MHMTATHALWHLLGCSAGLIAEWCISNTPAAPGSSTKAPGACAGVSAACHRGRLCYIVNVTLCVPAVNHDAIRKAFR